MPRAETLGKRIELGSTGTCTCQAKIFELSGRGKMPRGPCVLLPELTSTTGENRESQNAIVGLVGQGQEPWIVHVRMGSIDGIQVRCMEDSLLGIRHCHSSRRAACSLRRDQALSPSLMRQTQGQAISAIATSTYQHPMTSTRS